MLTAIWCSLPALIVVLGWQALDDRIIAGQVMQSMPGITREMSHGELSLVLNDIRNVVAGNVAADSVRPEVAAAARQWQRLDGLSRMGMAVLALCVAIAGGWIVLARISPSLKARNRVEQMVRAALLACSLIAIMTTVGIVLSVLYESLQFFRVVPLTEFIFGTQWSPQMAIRADQVGSSGAFGAVPLFAGTLLISFIAMAIAVPVGLFSAIYLAEYAGRGFRSVTKPVLEVLAGIPDRRLRLLRRPDSCAPASERRREPWAQRGFRERPGGRARDGHHDHPLRLVAGR